MRTRLGGRIDHESDPDFVDEPLSWLRWCRLRWRISPSASLGGLHRWLALILVAALLLVGLEIYRAVNIVPAIQHSQGLVARSFQIITAAHSLDQALQDAERGQRGFLITGEDDYLKPYEVGLQRIPEKFREIRRLIQQRSQDEPDLDALEARIDTKLAELKKSIDTRRQLGFDAARRIVSNNVGANAMTAITDQLETIIGAENRSLDRSESAFFDVLRINELTGAAAALLAFSVILAGGIMLWRTSRDIVRSQASLQRSEEQFRLLVTGVRDYALFMLDPTGNVASWNEGAERIAGYRGDEVVGRDFGRFFASDDAQARVVAENLLQKAAEAGTTEQEGWWLRKDGSGFWASIVITALRPSSYDRLDGYALVVRDISEQRRQQQALDQSRAALAQLHKMEAIGQLTGGVAHDFNNLLQSILGSIELLQRPGGVADPARATRLLDTARRAGERGAALTQRLLAFARRQPLAPQVVEVNKLVGLMSELLHRTLGETIRVETVSAAGLWRVHADANQLESAILNLAVNARDAMPRGGTLTIETGNTWLDDRYAATHAEVNPGQYVQIAISDSGEGMSKETLAHAFEPFFTTKPEGRGTGLGLAQVHGFVKQSGGHISLYSELGSGTTVKIYLPRYLSADEPQPVLDDFKIRAHREGVGVLLVEDDEDVRQYCVEALQTLGYTVFETTEGNSALRILDQHPEIALLFTDLGLPGLDGRKLAEEARRRSPRLKILYTTGYASNAVIQNRLLDVGVDLLGKPFTMEALGHKLEQVLGSR